MSKYTTRYSDIDSDHLAWMLVSVDARIGQRMDEIDYRSYDDYYQRAQLRYGAGFPAYEVLDDLWYGARCLRFQEKLHLTKVPVERFRPRRIQPLEVAILGGEQRLMRQVAEGYGIPVSPLIADMATPEVKAEVRQITHYFDSHVRDAMDLAGLAALCYSCALAALVRGFDDEALLAVRLYRQGTKSMYIKQENAHTRRYKRLLEMVEAFVKQDHDRLFTLITQAITEVGPTLRAGMTPEQWAKPPGTPNYLDCSPFCFHALCFYRERPLSLRILPPELEPHRDMLETLNTPANRESLSDEEARVVMAHITGQTQDLQVELMERQAGGEAPAEGGEAPAEGGEALAEGDEASVAEAEGSKGPQDP